MKNILKIAILLILFIQTTNCMLSNQLEKSLENYPTMILRNIFHENMYPVSIQEAI